MPTRILREMGIASRFLDRWQKNIFDAIIESEQCRGVRVVADTSRVFVLAPFSPRTNGEVWLIWKKPIVNLAECEDEDLRLLASLLVEVLKALNTELKIENLCVVVNQVPRDPAYRLHLKVLPFKSWAGGERGFDEYSVEVAPERVAAALGPVLRSGEVIS